MWTVISWILTGIGAVAIACGLVVLIAAFGYRRLKVSFGSIRIVPEFQFNPSSIAGVVVNAALRNFFPAAGSLVKGIRLDARVVLENRSPIALFIPETSTWVSIEDRQVYRPIVMNSFWLEAGANKIIPLAINLNKEDISTTITSGIRGRGKICIRLQFSARLGQLHYTKNTTMRLSMRNAIRSVLQQKKLENAFNAKSSTQI
jgi:hypothetical protein